MTLQAIETTAPVQVTDDAEDLLARPSDDAEEPAILADILVDELSIDGMCGVY